MHSSKTHHFGLRTSVTARLSKQIKNEQQVKVN